MRCSWFRWAGLLLLVVPAPALCQSVYHVSVDTTNVQGLVAKVAFDLISNRVRTNRVDIFNFETDGKLGLTETQGGLVAGDLIERNNPAKFTRMAGNHFRNELVVNFESLGKRISFSVNVSESAPEAGQVLDQFAFSLLDADGQTIRRVRNPEVRGDPNFTIAISGERGGRLEMYGRRIDRRLRGGIDGIDADGSPLVGLTITPAWITEEEENSLPIVRFHGDLEEFCTRRCEGETGCEGGEFGVLDADDNFYRFDDVGNLKTRVALLSRGKGDSGLKVSVTGSLVSKTVLRVKEIVIEE